MNPLAAARTTVARRLIARLALVGVALAIVVAAVQWSIGYRADMDALDARLAGIEHSYLPSIVENAWLNDDERLGTLIAGIHSLPNLALVEIRAPDGRVVMARGQHPGAALERAFDLSHVYQGKAISLGRLVVVADLGGIRRAALLRLGGVLVSNVVVLLGLAALLYLQVHTLVTGRLATIAEYARNLGRTGPAHTAPLELPGPPSADEFTELGHTLNRMRTELAGAYEAVTASESRYRELFTRSPVALFEEDFSAVRAALDQLRPDIEELEPWLDAHPEFIRQCAQLVRLIDVNDAALALHRADHSGELLPRLSAIFTPSSYDGFRRQVEAIWDGRCDLTLATEVRTLEGDILDVTVRWHVLPTHRDTYARVIVSCEDVTELKNAQRSADITLEKLMQANAELERFTFGASHDLQEPVRSIVSFSQLLERHLARNGIDGDAAEYLSFLKAAAGRMQLQVSGLLDYARAGQSPAHFAPVDLADALADARAALAENLATTGGRIEAGPLPVVSGDRNQLAEVFRHLIDNALKFRRPELAPVVRLHAERSGDCWRIAIEDNGIGIDPLYALGIFDVFRRLHGPAQFPGAGIGLSICRRILERHGGSITVDTAYVGGAALVLTLPAVEIANS